MTKLGLIHTIVLAEALAVLGFLTALDKAKDPDFVNIKARIIAFDINEKIFPKRNLPT